MRTSHVTDSCTEPNNIPRTLTRSVCDTDYATGYVKNNNINNLLHKQYTMYTKKVSVCAIVNVHRTCEKNELIL